ncbi:hypothetical protein SDC9_201226 [bioreactor metagenome]|uniref:Uncharacterized protein n=1 Tax=bioreactor metagenome TaxID=1076179 RepID=A0A645IRW4_9ZZZZ
MLPYHYSLTGQKEPVLYVGKKSGKDNIRYWLEKTGLSIPEDRERNLLELVKALSIELKRDLNEQEFRVLVAKAAAN